MTEKEFLLLYKERRNLKSMREAKESFETLWDSIFYALDTDENLIIKDWGIFEKKLLKSKRVFNISTKEIITTENKKVIKFRPREKMLEKLENPEMEG